MGGSCCPTGAPATEFSAPGHGRRSGPRRHRRGRTGPGGDVSHGGQAAHPLPYLICLKSLVFAYEIYSEINK